MIEDESQRVREEPRSEREEGKILFLSLRILRRRDAPRRDATSQTTWAVYCRSVTSIINARKNNRERDYRKPASPFDCKEFSEKFITGCLKMDAKIAETSTLYISQILCECSLFTKRLDFL